MLRLTDREPPRLSRRARSVVAASARATLDLGGAAALVPLWLWWSVWRGGEPDSVWLGALPLLAIAALLLARFSSPTRPTGWLRLSLAAGAGLVGWSGASLLWAADQGAALTATQRLALYVGSLALVVLWPPSGRGMRLLLTAFVVAGLVAAAVVLSGSGGGGRLLIDGRLAGPTDYPNATAALFSMTALAAVGLAARASAIRHAAAWAGVAAGLLAVGLLAQSRAGVVALCLSLCVALALSRARGTLVRVAIAIAAALLVVLGGLLSVRTAALRATDPVLGGQADVIGAVLIGALLAGLLLRAPRVRCPPAALRMAVGLAGVLAVGALALSAQSLVHAADTGLGTPDYVRLEQGSSRFTGDLASYRPDYWRVALLSAGREPLLGVGAGGFAATYLQQRHTSKAPLHAHSVWLETLAELGVPGLILLLLCAGGLAAGVAAALRQTRGGEREVRLAAALPLVFLAFHASVDWVSVFPVLAVPALALAGTAAAPTAPHRRLAVPRLAGLVGGGAVIVAAALAIPALAAVRLTDHALASWSGRPAAAIEELRLASRLDPLSARAPLALGIVAVEEHRAALAAGSLREAAARDASGWFPRYAAGLIAASRGDAGAADSWLTAALARNPHEPLVAAALAAGRDGEVVKPLDGVRQALAERG
jgi:hypothetical protein